jgi:mannitol-1-phosphate/altronate dehydrogenase
MASAKDKNFILENYGYEDLRPVFCEPFHQWILDCCLRSKQHELLLPSWQVCWVGK